MHQIVMDKLPELRKEAEKYWGKSELVIAHHDDNKMNYNVENLEWIPGDLNIAQRKAHPQHRPKSNEFYCATVFKDVRIRTKYLEDEDETRLAYDVITVSRPMPPGYAEYLFKYGMHRPSKYEHYYTSLELLQSLNDKYLFITTKRFKHKPKHVYKLCVSLDDISSEFGKDKIMEILEKVPFDHVLDWIVCYTGSRGAKIIFLIEKKCYTRLFKDNPSVTIDKGGYIKIDNDSLHRLIMSEELKLKKGIVLHGPGKTLDNRKRTLTVGTHTENNADRGDRKSEYPGVTMDRNKWKVQLTFGVLETNIGSFNTQDEAVSVSNFAIDHKEALIEESKILQTDKDQRAYIRKCCKAFTILPVSEMPSS
jgi:hypothetical protein